MKLINNQETRLFDELKPLLTEGAEVFICASYFTINAFFELESELKKVSSIQILVDNDETEDIRFAYDIKEWSVSQDLKGKFRASQVLKLVSDKCSIRAGSVGGQKFLLIKQGGKTHYFSIVPQDINLVSLGLIQSSTPIIISMFEDSGDQYFQLFTQFWNNSKKDIKNQILAIIEKSSGNNSPEFLYKFSLHSLFQFATINEESEQRIKKTGFKNTQIWKMLYNFQQDAVLGAIDKIETFGGCIIADSVGLGKTFEALAVMKYYQLRNDRILVLCPIYASRKLLEMMM